MSTKILIKIPPSENPPKRNSIAKSLENPLFRPRKIPNKKNNPRRERNELVKLLQQG